jgi:hypothetical protein
MLTLQKQKITIEHGRESRAKYRKRSPTRRKVIRTVQQAEQTGHVSYDWYRGMWLQWTGVVQVGGKAVRVWGYGKDDCPPEEWANDTY